jgi:hypothetical protein
VTVEETIVEVSKKHSGTGERMIIRPYPKDDESRTFGVRSAWLDEVAEHIRVQAIGRDELLSQLGRTSTVILGARVVDGTPRD